MISNHKIPGIGMRIVKSAVAMAICYLVNILRGGAGMVFYSQLAALWCIQMYRSNTMKNAIQRTIGTCIGAAYGLIYLTLYPPMANHVARPLYVEMTLVSICLLLVLYTTVLCNKRQASYFSCVVFLSIAVNHVSDVVPYLFVWNRFLDTMIGIAIGIAINDIHICINPDRDTLFVSGLDDTLLDEHEMLSPFSKVELNRMIDSGLKFTVSTIRTPASLIGPLRDVHLNLPVIAMDGAVLYDTKTNSYLNVHRMNPEITSIIAGMAAERSICWHANIIIDDVLIIYYDDMGDSVNSTMVNKLKVSPYRNYIRRDVPYGEGAVYIMLLDKSEKIEAFYNDLVAMDMTSHLRIVTYASKDYPGYSYIKVYNENASKTAMMEHLKERTGLDRIVTFGTIPEQYDVVIKEDDANEVVRRVRKLYEPFLIRRR